MLKKVSLLFVLTMLLLTGALVPQVGYCAAQRPEQFVLEFYAWYFKTDKGIDLAEKNDEIYAYVERETVKIALNESLGEYYFTKMASYSFAWNNVKVIAGDSVAMYGGIFVVPVTFRLADGKKTSANTQETYEDYQVVVFVKQENAGFRIIKVVDCYPYS